MKRILLMLLMLGVPAAASAQMTVTGHLKAPDASYTAGNTKVCFTLIGYSPNTPRVISTGILIAVKNFCINPASDGSYSTSLYGNPQITPTTTNWRVDFLVNGIQQSSATYLIDHSPFNLDTETPLSVSTPTGPNQLVVQSFPFTQATASTTWTIPHNFNDPNVFVQAWDANHKVLYPDTVTTSDPNNAVLTFVSAQAGFAVVMHSGSINIASNQPNAVIQNPTAPQSVAGTLNITGTLSTTNVNGFVYVLGTTAAAVNSAIQSLPGNGIGGTIFLPCNTDITTSGASVTVDRPLTMVGCNNRHGPFGTRIVSNDANIPLVLLDNQAYGVTFRNFGVCAGSGTSAAVGIDLDNNVSDITFDHIYLGTCGGTFSTAGWRVGSRTTGSPVLDVNFINTEAVGAPVGYLILRINNVNFYKTKGFDNTVAQEQIGDATHQAISVQHFGCDLEPNLQLTSTAVKILNGSGLGFHGCYFENDLGGYVFDVPSSATAADNIVIDGGSNFHGNATATSAIHSQLSSAKWTIRDSNFNNYPNGTTYIINDGSQIISVASIRTDNASTSLVGGSQGVIGFTYLDTNQGGTNSGTQFAQNVAIASGSTLAVGGGTPLATTNQSGTGSLCLTSGCALSSPALTTPTLGGETVSSVPRSVYNAYIRNASISTGGYWRVTLDKAITVTRVQVISGQAGATCSTLGVIRVTDGTTNIDTSLANGTTTFDSGALTANFSAGANLDVRLQTAASGCGTVPTDIGVSVQYRPQ